MRSLFFSLLGLIWCVAAQGEPLDYTIVQNEYRFNTYYEMYGSRGCEGRVIKESLRIRTMYDLYDKEGEYEAEAICRALSLGSLYTWAREIDIYDPAGNSIGFIEGKFFTTAQAKFNIYDGEDRLVANVYLDFVSKSFTLVEPSKNAKPLGQIKRTASGDWGVVLNDETALDARLVKIFSAFVVDHENSF